MFERALPAHDRPLPSKAGQATRRALTMSYSTPAALALNSRSIAGSGRRNVASARADAAVAFCGLLSKASVTSRSSAEFRENSSANTPAATMNGHRGLCAVLARRSPNFFSESCP
jgi:hypothetical protein